MTPFSVANIAISINHLLFAILGMISLFLGLADLPFAWAMMAIFVPMIIVDVIIWPLTYRSVQRDLAADNR